MEAKFLMVGDWVTDMKNGEDSMNPVALDWNWRHLCKLMDGILLTHFPATSSKRA